MDEITEGSIVALKSGGPRMTVIHLTAGAYAAEGAPKDKAYCQWFPDKSVKPAGDTFPLKALDLID